MPHNYVPKSIIQTDWTALEADFNYWVEMGCSVREAARKYYVKIMTLQDDDFISVKLQVKERPKEEERVYYIRKILAIDGDGWFNVKLL